ncbi:MAG: ATP-binding protein [Elusimicrobiota bacterium]
MRGLDQFIKKLEVQTHKRITVIDMKGIVIADSENDPKTMVNHKDRPEVQRAMDGNTGVSLRYSSTVKEDMMYLAIPLQDGGRRIGILRSSLFLKDIKTLLSTIMAQIAGITAIIMIIALFFAFLFSRDVSVSINKIKSVSEKIASGDFGARVTLNSGDELDDLAVNFNQMAGKIGSLFRELSGKKDELNAIISAITEGMFVIDSEDKISLSNRSFQGIAESEEVNGKYYWEVIRTQSLKAMIEQAKNERKPVFTDIELSGGVYASSAVPIPGGDTYIVVMHDITQIKDMEKKKREFVANVSHELRTPLTAIKGFAETLEDEMSGDGKRYVDIIQKHSERLINIVEDLLLLSKIEETGYKLEMQATDLKALLESSLKMFEKRVLDKNISIKLDIQDNIHLINADQFKLEQVLVNLVDNAIKYTENGGIAVSLKQDSKQTVISVSDSGIGISKEDIPHIFERFYVADKSRSRKAGGTGLGLSIVKHIVMLHNGSIDVDSTFGSGTTVTICLPRA